MASTSGSCPTCSDTEVAAVGARVAHDKARAVHDVVVNHATSARRFGVLGLGSRIAQRLLLWVMVGGVVAASMLSAWEYHGQRQDRHQYVADQVQRIGQIMVPALVESARVFDDQQQRLQLKAISQLPYVNAVRLDLTDGESFSITELPAEANVLRFQFPLVHADGGRDHVLGTLSLFNDFGVQEEELMAQWLRSAARSSLLILLVALAVSAMYHVMVTRRLVRAVDQLGGATVEGIRRGDFVSLAVQEARKRDELDELAISIHDLWETGRTALSDVDRESRRFQAIFEGAQDGIAIADIASFELVAANPKLCEMSGYDLDELVRLNVSELYPKELSRQVRAEFDRVVAGQPDRVSRVNMRRKNGDTFPVEISTFALEYGGRACLAGFIRDVSERVSEQRELERHRDHLEELVEEQVKVLRVAHDQAQIASKAKGEFLANMSHEIRTPLNAVLGMARMGYRDSEGQPLRDNFRHILKSGTHLLGVINDVLDFSKIEAGKLEVESRPLQLVACVEEAVGMVADRAQAKGLALLMNIDEALPAWVCGDSLRLRQVLVNLLNNAVKFTHKGHVAIDVSQHGDAVDFRVSDTGIGMSDEVLARLFVAFEQADTSTTRRYGGSGLGLAISGKLVQLMGGLIVAESKPGSGSRFSITLPLVKTSAPLRGDGIEEHVGSGTRLAGLRVLAAEDVEVNRVILADVLKHEGAEVEFAEDGSQALGKVCEDGGQGFDLVLMDVQMPVMDGLDAARQISRMKPDLPVVGLTAHALAEERQRCLDSGMVDHVTKPIEVDQLVAAIRRHVRRPPALPKAGGQVADKAVPTASAAAMMSPESSSQPGIVDWARLSERYQHRTAFIARVIRSIVDNHKVTLGQLEDALRDGDMDALRFAAHSIKGVAGNIEAAALARRAREVEKAARDGGTAVSGSGRELVKDVREMLLELERWLVSDKEGS